MKPGQKLIAIHRPFPRRGTGRSRGFSLVELLVSAAIFTLLLLVLQQILAGSSSAWKLGEARKERMQNARAITDFIALDLESALLPLNRSDTGNLQFIVNPDGIPAAFKNRDAFFWQAPRATDTVLGEVALLGYFVKWDTANPANPRALLCRFFANYGEREASAITANPNFRLYSQPSDWLDASVLQAVAPADAASGYRGLFAENVLGLWVATLDSAGAPVTASGQPFDSRTGYEDSLLGTLPACALPSAVEVSVALLDARSAARITPALQSALITHAAAAADAPEFVAAVQRDASLQAVRQGLRSHTARVALKNAP